MNWEQTERERSKFYRVFTKAWQKELYKEALPILAALKSDPNAIHYFQSINSNIDFSELYIKTWTITGTHFANLTRNQYGKKSFVDDYIRNELHRYATNEAGQRIVSIQSTNRDALIKMLNNELDLGLEQGLGPGEIAMNMQDAIKVQYAQATRVQALRIARTEIVGSTCRGQLIGAQSLGYNMRKTWIATIDRVTRDSHKAMAGKSVGLNDDFIVPGDAGNDYMQHPGDARASAGNCVNCRCSVGFEVI